MAGADDLSLSGAGAQVRVRTPMLAIFPGTTAAHAALEFMHQALELPERDRQRIALVYVDIDHLHPDLVAFRSRHPGLFNEKIVRIGVPRHVANIPRVAQDGDESEPHTYIDPKLPDAFENGARGIRNNGHVAFCHNLVEIQKNLTEAINQITSREANEGLPSPQGVHVNIASFIGGGTASGIVADLACLARQLLVASDLDPRINVTCILPTGVSSDDSDLRRSNAVACLLEMLALSMVRGTDGARYRKFVRARYYDLPPGPIAHEVYLIGGANMTDTRDIARIAGMDLFQRTLDASGVGALERSEAVNRISLGSRDDQDLPTMFGTSCPLDVRFPVADTALAFAQMAASHVLPLLAGYRPQLPQSPEAEQEGWRRAWREVAQIQATSGPRSVRLPELPRRQYDLLDGARLDRLWREVTNADSVITERVATIAAEVRREQEAKVEAGTRLAPEERVRFWQALQREYEVALADVRLTPIRALVRETSLEHRATRWWFRQRAERRLYVAHRDHLRLHAQNERRRQLEGLLGDLRARVTERLTFMRELATLANADKRAAELRQRALGSAAWRAQLDRPHPFQLHVLDLVALGRTGGPNPAVEQLYEWATAAVMGATEDGSPNYGRFLPEIAGTADSDRPEQSAEQLPQTVVAFLRVRYHAQLEATDLLRILEEAVPADRRRLGTQPVVDQALTELMEWLKTRMSDLVTFDERIGGERASDALKTEVFLGAYTGGGGDEARLRTIATRVDILRSGSDRYRESLDLHRVQASYQRHGISLATIYDFFSPVNSAMERYRRYQRAWHATASSGSPPAHACGELELLVHELQLVRRLVRTPASANGRPPDPDDDAAVRPGQTTPADHGAGYRAQAPERPLL